MIVVIFIMRIWVQMQITVGNSWAYELLTFSLPPTVPTSLKHRRFSIVRYLQDGQVPE